MNRTTGARRRSASDERSGSALAPGGSAARRLQMADIARMAGVSTTTVSRALAGSPLVQEATRTRVAELARSLHYAVNAGAKALRLGQTSTVALVVPRAHGAPEALADPFVLELVGAITRALAARGFDALVSRVDVTDLRQAAMPFDCGRAMGVILVGPWHHHDELNQLAARGVPLAVWGAQLPNQLYCTVGGNNVEGGRLATWHLLEQGRRRIAFLGDLGRPELAQRFEGYRQALAGAGLGVDPALASTCGPAAESARNAVRSLMERRVVFDAVFASSDLLAMGAINALREAARRVPEDVPVVGYDDLALAAQFHPPLTTVRQPIEAGAEALVELLLSHGEATPPRSHVLTTELIVRGSA